MYTEKEKIGYMKEFTSFTREETAIVQKTVDMIHDSIAIPCTAYRYCIFGCPKQIAILEYIALYNNQKQFGLLTGLQSNYDNLTVKFGLPPYDCIGCGRCESHYPQHLPIRMSFGNIRVKRIIHLKGPFRILLRCPRGSGRFP